MVAEMDRGRPVLDVVGRPTARGTTWLWARGDLDGMSVGGARAQLAALLAGEQAPRRVLLYLGAECFVDLRGLRLILDLAARVQCRGGALAVVAPPRCLTRMVSLLEPETDLVMLGSVRRALWWARTGVAG